MGKIIGIPEGRLMIATDMQGNLEDYRRVRSVFEEKRGRGEADILIFDGDLVHAPPKASFPDKSIEILDDLIDNPDKGVIPLLGNHEVMHIYHMGQVTRSTDPDNLFVEAMEDEIEQRGLNRERYVGYMKSMPFGVTTHSGVTITHTGANLPMARMARPSYNGIVQNNDQYVLIDTLDHDRVLENMKRIAREEMERESGHKLAPDYFDDYTPEIGKVFTRTPTGQYIWDVFFNGNEDEYGELWKEIVYRFLKTMSREIPQNFIISGHLPAPGGSLIVNDRQLRVSTSDGAAYDDTKAFVMVNARRGFYDSDPEKAMQQLRSSCEYLYPLS